MKNKIRILTLKFKNQINNEEIKWFRGAVINALKKDNILFHNHTQDNYRYSYPLIQYKRINNCAAIVCLEEGVEAIGQFFANYNTTMQIGNRMEKMEIDYVKPTLFTLQIWNDSFCYNLKRWLPLNKENYKAYNEIEGLADKITFLEKILTGNILSFTKGLGIHLEEELKCKILDITDCYTISNKGIKMAAFNIKFASNISIPNNIGLGKNASINCGVIFRADIKGK